MRLLDLFCGAGGAAVGYARAGFDEILGVDIAPQRNYPFALVQADALQFLRGLISGGNAERFDLIHASPPCQAYSCTRHLAGVENLPELVEPVRELLRRSGRPYVIENVPGAPLENAVTLCGSMFGRPLIRHRLFETNPVIWFPPGPHECGHLYTHAHRGLSSFENGASAICVAGNRFKGDDGRLAMGIDWMPKRELSQAVPPAYTQWIGQKMRSWLVEGVVV